MMYIGLSVVAVAQNLVPNPSFEIITGCPQNFKDFPAKEWYSPNTGTPDLYSPCNLGDFSTPLNWAGYTRPADGRNYVGIYIGHQSYDDEIYREYICCRLIEPLVQGKEYIISFNFVESENTGMESDRISFGFSNRRILQNNNYKLELPHYKVLKIQECEFGNGWYQVNTTYTATGKEEFFILGNLGDEEYTFTERNATQYNPMIAFSAYYFIDNISVEKKASRIEANPKLESNKFFVLNSILFDFDSYYFKLENYDQVNYLIAHMQSNPKLTLEVRGFTDQKGSKEYNAKLSENRAKAVKDYLVESGLEADRIRVLPMGVSQDQNLTEDQMRRVEFRIVD